MTVVPRPRHRRMKRPSGIDDYGCGGDFAASAGSGMFGSQSGLRTSIWPLRTRVSKHGCRWTAGPSSTRPSSSANRERCQGHRMLSPTSSPSESGPLKCEHVSAMAKIRIPRRTNKIGTPSCSARFGCASTSSESANTGTKSVGNVWPAVRSTPTRYSYTIFPPIRAAAVITPYPSTPNIRPTLRVLRLRESSEAANNAVPLRFKKP